MDLNEIWPLFNLRIVTPRLVLRLPTDADIPEFVETAKSGIHPPEEMPFARNWTDVPSPQFERNTAMFVWRSRAQIAPEDWALNFITTLDGKVIGSQGIFAKDFKRVKRVSSGSWLAQKYQGKGYGKEMRQAVLHLAFEGLGADVAETKAYFQNSASIGVSRSVGYDENGIGRLPEARGESYVEAQKFRLTREKWLTLPRPECRVEGLDECLPLLGLAD